MNEIIQNHFLKLIESLQPGYWPALGLKFLIILGISLILLIFAATYAGVTSYLERRIAGRMQSRIGPNLVGPQGIVQWIADGVKLVLKEDLIPHKADSLLFRIAPYFVFVGMFGAFVALPFGAGVIAADLDVGLYYIIAITALVVVGIIMGGWSSNSKWALFGALRSAAQIISYEIPTGLSLLVVILLAGSLSTQTIIANQGGYPWDWFVFHSPFTLISFGIFFISALAEGNRIPFDLPEAESELVAGYNTEYSGFRFVVFLMSEWANIWVISALVTLTYLGGWQVPGIPAEKVLGDWRLITLSLLIFCLKSLIITFVVIQLRWTLPRIRVDQMTVMCWTYLVPLALFCIVGTMLWMILFPWESAAGESVRIIMFLSGLGITVWFWWRVGYNYYLDRRKFETLRGEPAWYPPWRLP